MTKRIFVPIESYALASPEIRMHARSTDTGLFAEALILFKQIDLNVSAASNLADILQGFMQSFGSINPFLDLVDSGDIRIHYFDFISAPIEKDGILSLWNINIQNTATESSNQLSFQQKILYSMAIEQVIPKARHRQRLYDVITRSAVIDTSDRYLNAVEAAREASKSNVDIELLLNIFKDSLPKEQRKLFPEKIVVTANFDATKELVIHNFNFDFDKIKPFLPNLNFSKHLPSFGLLQTHRILNASRLHNYDIYLPTPLSEIVIAKMDSFFDHGNKFSKSTVDLTEQAGFPDIRYMFNEGQIDWEDVLTLRNNATRFQEWFALYGGNPDIALSTYGKEFRASTGIKGYRDKIFSIAKYVSTGLGTAVGAGVQVPYGAMVGAMVGGFIPFVRELIKASEEEGWRPRFFGNWVQEKIARKNN